MCPSTANIPKTSSYHVLLLTPVPQEPPSPKPIMLLLILIFRSLFDRAIMSRWPQLLRAAMWTVILALTVAVASFAPEIAFVSAISPSSSFSKSCNGEGFVRIPLDNPREVICFPAHLVRRSKWDFLLPSVFAALLVIGSAGMVRSFSFWDSD